MRVATRRSLSIWWLWCLKLTTITIKMSPYIDTYTYLNQPPLVTFNFYSNDSLQSAQGFLVAI